MDISRIYPKQARSHICSVPRIKAFPQTVRREGFNSTSKPLFVTEFSGSGSALYFHWMWLPRWKNGHKSTLLFESQSLVPAEPHLTQSFAFTLFFQNLTPPFLMFISNLGSAPYSTFFLPNIRKNYSFPQTKISHVWSCLKTSQSWDFGCPDNILPMIDTGWSAAAGQ